MSFTRPPRTSTTECSCRLCFSPGMYAVISFWLVNRTRAIFRTAEFGFLGVVVVTFTHTPRLNGEGNFEGRFFRTSKPVASTGAFDFWVRFVRPFRIN